jgi:DNA modification methylase
MLICGDSLRYLRVCPHRYRTIFADPPDNIGLKYCNYVDKKPDYIHWLAQLQSLMVEKSEVSWLSVNYQWLPYVLGKAAAICSVTDKELKLIIWRFTFGQYRTRDFGNGYRPIIRVANRGWRPDTRKIRVRSRRQELGDKRAVDGGRVPDDVWAFSRVVGNATERRTWHPTQHPEALIERIVLCSGGPVLDMFGGTGTVLRVCNRLGVLCDTVELDPEYCKKIGEENNETVCYF